MLLSSIHLICRPRTTKATGDWGAILRELPRRVAEWMQRLQSEHVRGADLVFACIGPALEVFSRYATVETAEGREVPLREYLEKVWEVVGRAALEEVLGGSTGALEEDARLTALFLWTLQSSNGVSTEAGGEGRQEEENKFCFHFISGQEVRAACGANWFCPLARWSPSRREAA